MVDVTVIDNAAHAHLNAIDRLDIGTPPAGKAYFISNGEPVELWAFIDRVLAEAGCRRWRARVSAWKAGWPAASGMDLLAVAFAGRAADDALRRDAFSTSHWYDISAANATWATSRRFRSRKGCGYWVSGCGRGREETALPFLDGINAD